MKSVSKNYILKMSEIITTVEIKKLLTKKLSDNDSKELVCKIYTTLVYVGLLWNCETFKIQTANITHDKKQKEKNITWMWWIVEIW